MSSPERDTVKINQNPFLASLLFENKSSISSISNNDKNEILMQTAIDGIESFAAGYDSGGFKATVDSFSNTIKSVQLLSGYSVSVNKEEDCGRRLYEDLDRIIKTFGREFTYVISVNFAIEQFRADCVSKRTDLDMRIRNAKTTSTIILIEPRKDRIEYRNSNTLELRKAHILKQNIDESEQRELILMEKRELDQATLKEYFEALDDYDQRVKNRNDAITELNAFQLEFDRATMVERVCNLFMDSILQLMNKVKDVVINFTNIQSVLKGTVIVRETKEQLCNPLENNNVSGVMEILYDRYQKKTFVSFTLNLMEAIGWSLSDDDSLSHPAKGVTEVQQLISKWRSRDMGKELNDDQLFTAILIKGLSPKAFHLRQTLLAETHKFIMNLSDEQKNSVDLPIFNFVCQSIITHDGTLQYTNKMRRPATVTFDTNKKLSNNDNKYTNKSSRDIVESAAAADANDNAFVADSNGKLYSGEVTRDKNIKYTHRKTNRDYPYVAVSKLSSICSKCYPESGDGNACGKEGENKKCYGILCSKCGMYGHPQAGCMQATSKKR